MKVLIVSPCVNLPIPAVKGGAVLTLIEYIAKENEAQQKMDLTVISIYDAEAEREAKKYHYTRFYFIKCPSLMNSIDVCIDKFEKLIKNNTKGHQYLRKLYSLRSIRRHIQANSYDRIIFQNSGYLLSILKNKRIASKYKGKLYYHLHNDIPDGIYLPGVKHCNFILISDYLKLKIKKLCGTNSNLVFHVVKNGFDCNMFDQELSDKERTYLLDKLNIYGNKKVVLFTGRINYNKGITQLIEAFTKIESEEVILLIVGSNNFGMSDVSDFQIKLKNNIEKKKDKIIFTGFVPYDEIWKYYKLADVAVLPSIWEEPAGLTMLEACAASIPLITTQSGGIPEYIPAEYCIMLPRDDSLIDNIKTSIEDVLGHLPEYKEKAKLAKDYVQQHYNTNIFYETFVDSLS